MAGTNPAVVAVFARALTTFSHGRCPAPVKQDELHLRSCYQTDTATIKCIKTNGRMAHPHRARGALRLCRFGSWMVPACSRWLLSPALNFRMLGMANRCVRGHLVWSCGAARRSFACTTLDARCDTGPLSCTHSVTPTNDTPTAVGPVRPKKHASTSEMKRQGIVTP